MSKKISKAQIKRNRKAWLDALRSGKYKQTKGKLKSRNGSYCCLGVACEVAGVPSIYSEGEYQYGPEDSFGVLKEETNDNYQDWFQISATGLPPVAQEWLGVSVDGPSLAKPVVLKDKHGDEHEVTSLISLNDDWGWSFEQIADAVEKNGLREGVGYEDD